MDTDWTFLNEKYPTGPPAHKWGKSYRYVAHLKHGGRLVIHCRALAYTGVHNYITTKLGIRSRLYKVWCTFEAKEGYKLAEVFKHPRYVKLRTPPLLSRTKSAKRAVALYLDIVYEEIVFSNKVRSMWGATLR